MKSHPGMGMGIGMGLGIWVVHFFGDYDRIPIGD
jgi:hypothetical protein